MDSDSRNRLLEEMSDCMVRDTGVEEMMRRVCAFFSAPRGGICRTEGEKKPVLLAGCGFDGEKEAEEAVQNLREKEEETSYILYPYDFPDFSGFLFLERPSVDGKTEKMQQMLGEICRNMYIAIHHRELVQQLQQREEELQYVCNALLEIKEKEEKRIALELHDEIGQNLTSMLLYLRLCQKEPAGERLTEILTKLRLLVSETLSETRRIVRHMRPKELEELGLVPALYWYFSEYKKRQPQISFVHTISISDLRIPEEAEMALYRVIVEALTNISRHARADHVCFSMAREENRLHVQVEDNGCGMELESAKQRGMGLLGMQERIHRAGGHFFLDSAPGSGTRLSIWLPLAAKEIEDRGRD